MIKQKTKTIETENLKMIELIDNNIKELKEYYPIPNLFLGLSYEESINDLYQHINKLKKIRRFYENEKNQQ
jgi:hypothetical protein